MFLPDPDPDKCLVSQASALLLETTRTFILVPFTILQLQNPPYFKIRRSGGSKIVEVPVGREVVNLKMLDFDFFRKWLK